MTNQIPEQWWIHHKDHICQLAKNKAAGLFESYAHEFNWDGQLDGEEDFLALMRNLEPRLGLPAADLLDAAIDAVYTNAVFDVFQAKYGHLCNKDEKGEILIPTRCIPELHGLSDAEIESRVENLLKDHPGTAFCIPDPNTETIN
jgi:hypothetical protein